MPTFDPLVWTADIDLSYANYTQHTFIFALPNYEVKASNSEFSKHGRPLSYHEATATPKMVPQKPLLTVPTVSEVDSTVNDLVFAVSP